MNTSSPKSRTRRARRIAVKPLPDTLARFTADLIGDLNALRDGRITLRDARVRADLAREILRAVHLHLEGLRVLGDAAKELPAPQSAATS